MKKHKGEKYYQERKTQTVRTFTVFGQWCRVGCTMQGVKNENIISSSAML